MSLRALSLKCLSVLLLAGCSETDTGPQMVSPATGALTSLDPAASPQTAGITITLDMQPNSSTAVPFLADGKKVKDFVLDDDVTSGTPSSKSFTKLKAGTYTFQANAVAGLSITAIDCTSSVIDNNAFDLDHQSVTIQIEDGESVSCTFVGSIPTWTQGDVSSYSQLNWDASTGGGALLTTYFDAIYSVFDIGVVGSSTFSASFSSASALLDYLPTSGPPDALDHDLSDTQETHSGVFGGDVATLKLNIDFSDHGYLPHNSVAFGELYLCGVTPTGLQGSQVRALLPIANTFLSGGTVSGYSLGDIDALVQLVNFGFVVGTPSAWAQQHLFAGPCP